jgi:hypothetical protein
MPAEPLNLGEELLRDGGNGVDHGASFQRVVIYSNPSLDGIFTPASADSARGSSPSPPV